MSFCTNCGNPITEGQTHSCQAPAPAGFNPRLSDSVQAGSAMQGYGGRIKDELTRFDKGTLLGLLRNPMSALRLRGDADLRYGLIGLAASLLGYMLWAWSFKRNAIHTLFELMGGSDSEWRDAYREAGEQFAILSPLFVIGLVSLIVLTGGAILLGGGLGSHKVSWKESLAKIGSVQLAAGAGFLICALTTFVSLRVGLILLLVVLLSVLTLTLFASAQLFQVVQARLLPLVTLFTLLVVVVIAITCNLQVQAGIENMASQFLDFL